MSQSEVYKDPYTVWPFVFKLPGKLSNKMITFLENGTKHMQSTYMQIKKPLTLTSYYLQKFIQDESQTLNVFKNESCIYYTNRNHSGRTLLPLISQRFLNIKIIKATLFHSAMYFHIFYLSQEDFVY